MQAVTIAQVHSAAVGGGVLLMAACDLRVVATGTVMFIPEVDLGSHYSWGAVPLLPREQVRRSPENSSWLVAALLLKRPLAGVGSTGLPLPSG